MNIHRHTPLAVGLVAFLFLENCVKVSDQTADSNAKSGNNAEASNANWEKVVDGLNFPEGPAWDGDSTLYFSNCYGGWISRLTNGRADSFLLASESPLTFNKTNGMVFHQGSLFACDFGLGAILKISKEGKSEIYAKEFEGQAFNRPNDLAFDGSGNLYFSDPKSYSREILDGRVFRVRAADQKIEKLAESLGFPNGIAFSPDRKNLYVCESAFERILRFDVTAGGELANKEVFIELPGGDPDGIDFDSAGNLYAAHFGGGTVYVIAPDRTIKEKIATPGKKPTNLAFGGDDLKTLYLTEVETNALYQRRLEVAGLASQVVQ